MKSPFSPDYEAQLVQVVDPCAVASRWKGSLAIDVGQEFRGLAELKLWECPLTRLRWYTPAAAAGGDSLYRQLQGFEWYYMKDKWEFGKALELLERESTLLEVGVGNGHFLNLARKSGHLAEGVELNSAAAKKVREIGFTVHERNLAELKECFSSHFDSVCSFQVLEHVPYPREFIEDMLGLVRSGGKLILSVPNAEVMRRIDPKNQNLLNQPPHHMSHWNEHVFRALEDLLGFRVSSVHYEPLAIYHVDWMVIGYLRNCAGVLGETVSRVLVNRYSTWPICAAMRAGLRKYFQGHTLLVELEKS